MSSFWCAAQLQPGRQALALHMLVQENFTVYAPKLRERRVIRGRREDRESLLFPSYAFVLVQLQWHRARWCPGVLRLIMDGIRPAKVPDGVIEKLRGRERNGAVELPRPRGLRRGDRVRVLIGPFAGHLGLYAGMRPRERVAVLLGLFGAQRQVELGKDSIEPVEGVS
jgi:transcriptional antiterminator RfaH